MAEFCLPCWNKMNETNVMEKEIILSRDLDLCEGCTKMKRVIIRYRYIYLMKEWLGERREMCKKDKKQ